MEDKIFVISNDNVVFAKTALGTLVISLPLMLRNLKELVPFLQCKEDKSCVQFSLYASIVKDMMYM